MEGNMFNGAMAKAAFKGLKKMLEKAMRLQTKNPDYKILGFELTGVCEDKDVKITEVLLIGNDGSRKRTKI